MVLGPTAAACCTRTTRNSRAADQLHRQRILASDAHSCTQQYEAMAHHETDPLLPNDRPAPEVSAYGSPAGAESAEAAEPPQHAYNSDQEPVVVEPAEVAQQSSVNTKSLLLTTVAALACVVILAAAILPTLSIWRGRLTTAERVDKILSDTPLIG
jgi:hypothetical protein